MIRAPDTFHVIARSTCGQAIQLHPPLWIASRRLSSGAVCARNDERDSHPASFSKQQHPLKRTFLVSRHDVPRVYQKFPYPPIRARKECRAVALSPSCRGRYERRNGHKKRPLPKQRALVIHDHRRLKNEAVIRSTGHVTYRPYGSRDVRSHIGNQCQVLRKAASWAQLRRSV